MDGGHRSDSGPPALDLAPESVPVQIEVSPPTGGRGSGSGRSGNARKGKEKGKEKAKEKAVRDNFVWEDDEVELLLTCTADYKSRKLAEGTDWESILNFARKFKGQP